MSKYENYNETSKYYDLTRVPVGIDIIIEAIARHCTVNDGVILLDAGCGTGAYTAKLQSHLKKIEAIDLNPNMLNVAEARLASIDAKADVNFQVSSISALPFQNETMDVVMVNQVLHHLGDSLNKGWEVTCQAMAEFFRVLKPRGILIVNSSSHKQMDQGFWHYSLIPDAVATTKSFLPSDQILETLIQNPGFRILEKNIPFEDVLQGDEYLESHKILDESWRAGDSIWSLVSESALEDVTRQIKKLLSEDCLSEFMQNADKNRLLVGQTTFTIAQK